jgi:hypothetical protein
MRITSGGPRSPDRGSGVRERRKAFRWRRGRLRPTQVNPRRRSRAGSRPCRAGPPFSCPAAAATSAAR